VLPYALCLILMGVGIYAMVAKKNVVKIIVGLCVMEYAVNMLLVVIGWEDERRAADPPRGRAVPCRPTGREGFHRDVVDPLPQALVM